MTKKIIPIILAILVILFFTLRQSTDLAVHFLDIGQGDSILITTPDHQNILIDGGPDNNLIYQVASHLPWWDRTIDYVVVSHWHDDHFMGLMELLNKYKVKNILVTQHEPDDFLYQVFAQKLKEQNLEPIIVKAGESFVLDDNLYFKILSAEYINEDFNDNSLVMRLSYSEIDFLFTGDLTSRGEARLLANNFVLDSEVLKIGHHGSKYSSSPEFLQAVSPEACLIQVGADNTFGHPNPETLDRLATIGCQIYRNDESGTITIKSSGQAWWLEL